MTLLLAEQQAGRILTRERKEPTVHYRSVPIAPNGARTIYTLYPHPWEFPRDHRPRKVRQNAEEAEFLSDNFELLTAIEDTLSAQERAALAHNMGTRIGRSDSFHHRDGQIVNAGTARQSSSELPLIAEFLVRKGWKPIFLRAFGNAAISPGLTLMVMQLEDMIAFNFMLFRDAEYVELSNIVAKLELELTTFDPKHNGTRESNTIYHIKRELPPAFTNLKEVIEQAHVALIRQFSRPTGSKGSPMHVSTPTKLPAAELRVLEALPRLHKDLRGYAHYFREGKQKEAVAAAFTRLENRLNETRDTAVDDSVKAISGPSLVHKLFICGIMDLPFPALASGNPKNRDAYKDALRNFLASGIGWFRNSYSHEPHNLPEPSDWDALELLFIASHMLKLLDLSLSTGNARQSTGTKGDIR